MREPITVAFGIGSNLGDRRAHLAAAVAGLRKLGSNLVVSPYYSTAPVGGPGQDRYLNAVVVIESTESPRAIMETIRRIESERGRFRRERWGPRTLDIDLLLYGDATISEPGLEVPHPRMTERRFVLAPLHDVWPDAHLPDGRPIASLLEAVADQDVTPADDPIPHQAGPAALLFLAVALAATALWWVGDWLLG